MRVLVVGSDPWVVAQAERGLAAHEVVRCGAADAPPFPCSKFLGGPCPVDEGVDVVALMRSRVAQEMLPGELGAVCGLRAGVPLVGAGLVEGSPFATLVTATVPTGGRLADVCADVAVVDLRVS